MKFDRFMNNQAKPFHSNGYAEAANGGSMGAVSSQSFQQRQQIEKNRRAIGRYGASYVAQGNHLQSELRKRLESPQEQQDDTTDPRHRHKPTNRWQSSQAYGSGSRGMITPQRGGAAKTGGSQQRLQVPSRRTSFVEPPKRGYNPYG